MSIIGSPTDASHAEHNEIRLNFNDAFTRYKCAAKFIKYHTRLPYCRYHSYLQVLIARS